MHKLIKYLYEIKEVVFHIIQELRSLGNTLNHLPQVVEAMYALLDLYKYRFLIASNNTSNNYGY